MAEASAPDQARERAVRLITEDLVTRGLFESAVARRMAHIVVVHGVEEQDLLLKDPAVWWDMHRLLHSKIPGQDHRHT